MSMLRLSSLAILLTFAGCTSDSGGVAPKAPTGLTAAALSGGAHLTGRYGKTCVNVPRRIVWNSAPDICPIYSVS